MAQIGLGHATIDAASTVTRWRSRSLAETLACALAAAPDAGVARLGDITGLDIVGLPVFQAVRPMGRCLSVTLGKGLSRRAAMVSALMEAIETGVAERAMADRPAAAIAELGAMTRHLWCDTPRDASAIRLDPHTRREWLTARDLGSGQPAAVPLDLVTLDFARPIAEDIFQTTVGLASGNSREEALLTAIGEVVEHDLDAAWEKRAGKERWDCEINLASIDDPAIVVALRRIEDAGRRARLWSIGQDHDVPAFECVVADAPDRPFVLPPVRGSACHPIRAVAALSAILEAAQGHPALISGARDDLTTNNYCEGERRALSLLLSTFGFQPARLAWGDVPERSGSFAEGIAALLDFAHSRSILPVLAVDLPQPHPDLHVARAVAPGLAIARRRELPIAKREPPIRLRCRKPQGRRLLFIGPSLAGVAVPPGIEVRPPAVAGDFAALLDDPPAMVGLIDGAFEQAPSVWHKEMLDLVARGTVVLAGASLGALRAAELHRLGVIGVGEVFRHYRDGLIRRDDAVMVLHAPAELGYLPVTIALVDAEATLRATPMLPAERRALQRIARTMSFRERSWRTMLDRYEAHAGRPASVAEATLAAAPSIKQQDAITLVAMLAGPLPRASPRDRPPLTHFYTHLLDARKAPSRHQPARTGDDLDA